MREIKFRAWDGEQMVSPDYISRDGRAHWKADSIPTSTDKVMQYTGLRDKNGVMIFEGDVVRKWWGTHSRGEQIQHIFENHAIEFSRGRVGPCEGENVMEWRLSGCENLWDGNDVEVIGNIYENPELIEAKQ